MNFFLQLCSFDLRVTDEQLIQQFLIEVNSNSSLALPENYKELYAGMVSRSRNPTNLLRELLAKLASVDSASTIVKIFTIITRQRIDRNYDQEFLSVLEEIEMPTLTDSSQMRWFADLSLCLVSYFARMPSVGDIMNRAQNFRQGINIEVCLVDIFRIVNQVGLLFPHLNNCINVVGRYYLSTSQYFKEFYLVLREELFLVYSYLKYAVEKIVKSFKECQETQLDCFMKTLPEIELICDKLEDFLMNKYFKGKNLARKIYLQEEQVSEITYFLKLHRNENSLNDSALQKNLENTSTIDSTRSRIVLSVR